MSENKGFFLLNKKLHEVAVFLRYVTLCEFSPILCKYDFINEEAIVDVSSAELEKNGCEYVVDYYWITFTKDNKKYKVTLFYKDFDCDTGYVHVLPGVIQIWENDSSKCKDKSLESAKTIHSNKRVLFSENEWFPILNEYHSILDLDIDETIKTFLSGNGNELTELELKNLFLGNIENSKRGHGKYSIMHWKDHSKTSDGYFYTLYFTWKDKNGYWWTRYGDIQFWRNEEKIGKRNSANRYINKQWVLHYPGCDNPSEVHSYNPDMNIYKNTQSDIENIFQEFVDFWKSELVP